MRIADKSLFEIYQPSVNSCYATTLHICLKALGITIGIRRINKTVGYNPKYGVHEPGAEARLNEVGKKHNFIVKSRNNMNVEDLEKIIADRYSSPPILTVNIEYLNLHTKKFTAYTPLGPDDQIPQHQVILNKIDSEKAELIDTYIPHYNNSDLRNPIVIETPKLLKLWFENSTIWIESSIKEGNLLQFE